MSKDNLGAAIIRAIVNAKHLKAGKFLVLK
jgi:hypothetical protein